MIYKFYIYIYILLVVSLEDPDSETFQISCGVEHGRSLGVSSLTPVGRQYMRPGCVFLLPASQFHTL